MRNSLRGGRGGAFCALSRGFSHWASGQVDHVEVNLKHPMYCHVKCTSMKPENKAQLKCLKLCYRKTHIWKEKKAMIRCKTLIHSYLKLLNEIQ